MAKLTSEVEWASVLAPNTTYEPMWCVNMLLNANQEDKLRSAGLNVKTNANGRSFIQLKRKIAKRDGTTADAPEVVDTLGNPWPASKLIGNGSVLEAHFSINEWKMHGKSGKSTYLNKIVVINHVPYGDSVDFDDAPTDMDGFDPE